MFLFLPLSKVVSWPWHQAMKSVGAAFWSEWDASWCLSNTWTCWISGFGNAWTADPLALSTRAACWQSWTWLIGPVKSQVQGVCESYSKIKAHYVKLWFCWTEFIHVRLGVHCRDRDLAESARQLLAEERAQLLLQESGCILHRIGRLISIISIISICFCWNLNCLVLFSIVAI